MNSIVVIEDNRGKVHRMSKAAIVGAQKLGGNVFALVIGENASSLSSDLSCLQLTQILVVEDDLISTYNADGYSEVVSQIV